MRGDRPIGTEYERESLFAAHIRARARHLGWLVYGVPDSRRSFDSGFLDLVMVHPQRLLMAVVECKSDTGRYTPEQAGWIDALVGVSGGWSGFTVEIWRPRDADRINRYLEGDR